MTVTCNPVTAGGERRIQRKLVGRLVLLPPFPLVCRLGSADIELVGRHTLAVQICERQFDLVARARQVSCRPMQFYIPNVARFYLGRRSLLGLYRQYMPPTTGAHRYGVTLAPSIGYTATILSSKRGDWVCASRQTGMELSYTELIFVKRHILDPSTGQLWEKRWQDRPGVSSWRRYAKNARPDYYPPTRRRRAVYAKHIHLRWDARG